MAKVDISNPNPKATYNPVAGRPNIVNGPIRPGTTTPAPPGSTNFDSATALITQTLTAWGLASLLPHVKEWLAKGYDATTIDLAARDTKEWHLRFAGNDIRVKNGLSVLSPAQYIATEEQYRNVMQQYGIPAGFYDSHNDFNDYIGKDVSPNEMLSRVQAAHDQYLNAPAANKQWWAEHMGSQGDAIAFILDPNQATQVINDRLAQTGIGGAALGQGFDISAARAGEFQQHGTTLSQAQAAYRQIAASAPTDQSIAQRFGQTFGQTQEENDLLLQSGTEAEQRRQLYNSEAGLFAGRGDVTPQSLGVSQSY